jgi:uncharacterized membrane protein
MSVAARWRVMTVLAFLIAGYAVVLIVVPNARPPFVRDRIASVPLALFGHLAASAVALCVGPFQFDASLRARRPRLHRWIGRIYLGGILVGGVSGLILARISQGGMVAHAGFACLAVAWLLTGVMAYRRILAGDTVRHRRWMIRNYALTFAAVTLRIYLPVSLLAGIPFALAYPAISWLCWVPNLVVVETYVRHVEGATTRSLPPTAPPLR